MDCNRIPNVELWESASVQLQQEYNRHLKSCLACRKRVLAESPDRLLHELNDEWLPEEFWIGFWDSLEKKLPASPAPPKHRWMQVARWAAVFVAVLLLSLYKQNIPESPSYEINRGEQLARPFDSQAPTSSAYPLIENVQDPGARYYIFQSGKSEKIVLIVNPNMEL